MLWLIPFLLMACSSGEEASPDSGSSQPDRSPEKQIDPGLLTLLEAHPHLSFEEPLHYEVLPDTGKAFVVERQGTIQMFDAQEDAEQAEVILDLSDVISASGSEMGLLGLALHPEFEANGYFFVNYTTEEGTVIARMQADPETFSVDENTQTTLLAFPQPYPNHNGGHLAFGTDGYLYIGVGDGGGSGDPEDNAQDLNELYGKLLRIDVDETSSGRPYAIPADNPFAENGEGIREEIFACGLRNPWKFSFDEERQWLWLADVGQNRLEEINVIESGQNYGWNIKEGTQVYEEEGETDAVELIDPVYEYDHSEGQSVTGGHVYDGQAHPELTGSYIYGDFVSGRVWALWKPDEETTAQNVELMDTDLMISSFGVDQEGEVILVDYNGKLYRLEKPE